MELRRHIEVLWRFKALILGGILAGIVLATVSLVKVPSFEFREKVVWSSLSQIYVTQEGFPEGRTLADTAIADAAEAAGDSAEKQEAAAKQPFFAEPSRFASLALLYSYLLSSQELKRSIGPFQEGWELLPAAVVAGSGSKRESLPLIDIDARANDPKSAQELNRKAIDALRRFVTDQQQRNQIAQRDRVRLDVVTPPKPAVVAQGRSYTGAAVVFVLCLVLATGIAYVLENLKPSDPRGGIFAGDVEDEWDFELPDDEYATALEPVHGHSSRNSPADDEQE
jgi:hypothetical protein